MKIAGIEISKKMTVAVATIVLIALNKKLGLGMTEDSVLALAISAGSYAAAQGWVDSKENA